MTKHLHSTTGQSTVNNTSSLQTDYTGDKDTCSDPASQDPSQPVAGY